MVDNLGELRRLHDGDHFIGGEVVTAGTTPDIDAGRVGNQQLAICFFVWCCPQPAHGQVE